MWMSMGYSQQAVLDYIGYPHVLCMSIATQPWSDINPHFANMPDAAKNVLSPAGVDDDLAFYYTPNKRGNINPDSRQTLVDMQRGWGSPINFALENHTSAMRSGDEFSCALFNSARAARPNAWRVEVAFSNGSGSLMIGGENRRDFDDDNGQVHYHQNWMYFDNGAARIPSPAGWPPIKFELPRFDNTPNNKGTGQRTA